MKKMLFVGMGLVVLLTGCASSKVPMFPDYSITGEFPINYIDVVQEKVGPSFKVEFPPKGHYDGWNSGWISCLSNPDTKERISVVVRSDRVKQIIRKDDTPDINYKCDVLKAINDRDWMKRWSVYRKEFEKIKEDPTKEHLFGKYPQHPNVIVKSYMFNVLSSPLSAQYKDMKINKTYYTEADNGYKMNYGYNIEVKINSINPRDERMGYMGFSTYHILVKDDIVLEHLKSSFN